MAMTDEIKINAQMQGTQISILNVNRIICVLSFEWCELANECDNEKISERENWILDEWKMK